MYGRKGMPVTETPTVIRPQVILSVNVGLVGKQKINFCLINLLGLALLGNLPMLCFGIPFEEKQDSPFFISIVAWVVSALIHEEKIYISKIRYFE